MAKKNHKKNPTKKHNKKKQHTELNNFLNWIMSINKINKYIKHSLKSILLFIHWVLKPNTEKTTLLPLPPAVKFYLLISLLPPTVEVNYNCGSILSKIYSTKRYLKEDNHSGSIFTLLIKEQRVHLLKISKYLLVLREYSPLTVFFSSCSLFLSPKSKEFSWGQPGRGMSNVQLGTILVSLLPAPLVLLIHAQNSS